MGLAEVRERAQLLRTGVDVLLGGCGEPVGWPRHLPANADGLADPDAIFPGQVLHIPR